MWIGRSLWLRLLPMGLLAAGCGGDHRAALVVANKPTSSSSAGFDFTTGYLPAGYHLVRSEHEPPNQFVGLDKRYRSASGDMLLIAADRGRVMSPEYFTKMTGGFKVTTVDGKAAAVGAKDGHGPSGGAEVFLLARPDLTIDVEDLGPRVSFRLSLAQVERIALDVRANQ
jgi:hypothetical protein